MGLLNAEEEAGEVGTELVFYVNGKKVRIYKIFNNFNRYFSKKRVCEQHFIARLPKYEAKSVRRSQF